MSQQLSGEIRQIDLDTRTGRMLSSDGKRVDIYFGPGILADIKAAFGKPTRFFGQWVDGLFFDVMSVVG